MTKKALAIFILVIVTALAAPAQDTREQESRKARLENEIKMLESQLKDNSSKSSNALASIKILSQKEASRRALIKESEKEIAALDDSLRQCAQEINALQARLDTMTLYYNRLVKNAYKNRDARVWYMYLLASENLGQAAGRFGYLRSLSGQMNGQGKKILATRSELETKMNRLKDLRAKAETLRKKRQMDLDNLASEQKQAKNLVARLTREKTKYQKELASKKKQVEALNAEIQKIIAAAVKKSSAADKKGGAAASKTVDQALAKEFQENKGKLPWPAEGPVADHFGKHSHPVYKSVQMPFNNGVNVSVAKGTEIKAVFDGEVIKTIVMPGYNKCVLVQHGDYFTFYCKLSSVSVKTGQKLKTGQAVGIVDTIDGLTQFHFQLWKGTTPQDPELWLRPRD